MPANTVPPSAEQRLITRAQAQLVLGVSGDVISALLKDGTLPWEADPFDKRRRLIPRAAVEALRTIDGRYLEEARRYLNGVSRAKFRQFIKTGLLSVQRDLSNRRYIRQADLDRFKRDYAHLLPTMSPAPAT